MFEFSIATVTHDCEGRQSFSFMCGCDYCQWPNEDPNKWEWLGACNEHEAMCD